jgi:hypothetical protein
MVGTRGALGPQAVSRFLDLHTATPWGVGTVYVRDIDSSIDHSYGVGAGFHGWEVANNVRLSLNGDYWKEPRSVEDLYDGTGWNVTGEIDMMFSTRRGRRWGFTAKAGSKSEGFFPGRPIDEGGYFGLGVTSAW